MFPGIIMSEEWGDVCRQGSDLRWGHWSMVRGGLLLVPLSVAVCVPVAVALAAAGQGGAETAVLSQSITKPSPPADKQFAQPYGSHLQPILERIQASPEQRRKISEIVSNYRPKIDPLRQEYREKSKEFIEFIIEGKPAEVIMARQGELNNLYGVIVTEYSMMSLEIRRNLSPAQCRQFEQYRKQQGWKR